VSIELHSWRHPTKWHVVAFGGEPYCLRAEALCDREDVKEVFSFFRGIDSGVAVPPLSTSGFGREDDRYVLWLFDRKKNSLLTAFLEDYDNEEAVGHFSVQDVTDLLADTQHLIDEEFVRDEQEVRTLQAAHKKMSRKFLYELTGSEDGDCA
jgi:hypothetical protein